MRTNVRWAVGVGLAGVFAVVASLTPTSAAGQTQVETPAYCQVLTTLGGGLTIDALTGTWPEPAAVTCHATGTGDIGEVWLTPVGSAAAASEAVATASRSWANPQWLEGFESGFGGGGENLPEGDLQRKNWVLYFARGTYVVHLVSGWVVDADPFGLELSSATAQSVVASARSLDAALQTPDVYGLPMAAGATTTTTTTTTTPDEAVVSPFVDGSFGPEADEDEYCRVVVAAVGSSVREEDLREWCNDVEVRAEEVLSRDLKDAALEDAQRIDPTRTELTAGQRHAIESLGAALSLCDPRSLTSLPLLCALQPVLVEMAATAVGPPEDADAARALNRTIRLAIAIALGLPAPNTTTGG